MRASSSLRTGRTGSWDDCFVKAAVLCDVHGNLPALRAVVADVSREEVGTVVIGGDVATGPLPRETLDLLMGLKPHVHYVRGNADREAVAAYDEGRCDPGDESDPVEREAAFTASRLTPEQRDLLAGLPTTVTLQIEGLGPTVFCHGSPRSDVEIITTATPEERLAEVLTDVVEPTVVGGHTHRQFDRRAGTHRFVNAGSVGRPYEGRAGAYWALLGPDVSLRQSRYDIASAVNQLRPTGYPDVDDLLRESLTDPVDADEVAAFFEGLATDS
ncbi:MAG: metallophosphoesterase family protein [Solirubrobacteraceae bacterium]